MNVHLQCVRTEVFRWQDTAGSVFWFNVTAMREAAREREPIVTLVDPDEAELIAVANDIDRAAAEKLSAEQLAQPILVWEREDGSHVVVDGSHRLWRNAVLRRPQLLAMFQSAEVARFLMPNAAELETIGGERMSEHRDAAMAEFGKRGRL